MAIIAFRAAGNTQSNATLVTSAVVNKPALPTAVQQGDLMQCVVTIRSTTITMTPPAGWTQVGTYVNSTSGSIRSALFYKIAAAAEAASWTWTFSSSVEFNAEVHVCSGANPTTPIASSSFLGSGVTSPIVTTPVATTNDEQLVTYFVACKDNTTHTWTDDKTERDEGVGGDGSTYFLSCCSADSAGPQGSYSATFTHSTGTPQGVNVIASVVNPNETPLDWVAAVDNSSTGAATTCVSTKPTGTLPGHVIVASVTWNSATATLTAPSGWVAADVLHTSSAGSVRSQLWTKVCGTAEPATYTWTFSASVLSATSLSTYSGVNNTTPVDSTSFVAYGSGGTAHDSASLTCTAAGQVAVYAIGDSQGTFHAWNVAANHSERTDHYSNTLLSTSLVDSLIGAGPYPQSSIGGTTINTFTSTTGTSNGGVVTALMLNGVNATLTNADNSASSTDTGSVTALVTGTETGTGTEIQQPMRLGAVLDGGTGTDTGSLLARPPAQLDGGTGTERPFGLTAYTSRTDTGAGAEAGARNVGSIVDDFSETALTSDWNDVSGATLDTIANRIKIPCTGPVTSSWIGTNPVNLYGSSVYAKVTAPPVANGSTYMGMYLTLDANNYVSFVIAGGLLTAKVVTAGVTTTTVVGPYAPEGHQWLRVMDDDAGNVLFSVSPNGYAWTPVASIPIGFLRGALSLEFRVGYTGTEPAGMAGYIEYVNSPPPPPPLGPSVFQVMVELSLDAPMSATPSWQDITPYVDCVTGLKFSRGRADIFTTTESCDLSLILSNVDGRFTRTNPASPYYPNLRMNNRIRVSIIYLGVTYTRGTFYVNEWPNKWEGTYGTSEVTASDVFKIVEKKSNSRGNYTEEALADGPVAYYPLDEGAPSITFGNINLAASVVNQASALRLVRMTQAQVTGDDTNQKVDFASIGYGDSNGAPDSGGGIAFTPLPGLHQGGYILQGNLPTALPTNWAIEFWIYAPGVSNDVKDNDDYSAILNLNAGTRLASSLTIAVDAGPVTSLGNVMLAQEKGSAAAFTPVKTRISNPAAHLTDGKLHMVTVEYTSATHTTKVYVDGVLVATTTNHTWPTGLRLLTVGGKDDRAIVSNASLNTTKVNVSALKLRLSVFNGTLSNVAVFDKTVSTYGTPASRYAGGQGWNNEYDGARIKRLLALTGLPSSMYAAVGNGTQLVGSQFTRDASLLDAGRLAAQVEDMPLYVNRNGVIAFDPRTARDSTAYSPALSISAVEFKDISYADDDAFIVNIVEIDGTYIGKQTLQNLDGGTSIANFGEYRKSLTGLPLFSDSQVFNLARRLLNGFANPSPRVNALVLENAAVLPAATYITILGLEPNSSLALTDLDTTFPEHNFPSPFNTYVEGIEEVITANVHQFTFNQTAVVTNDANFADNGDSGFWQLGVAGRQELGTNTVLDL